MVPGFAESLLATRILKESLDTYAELAADKEDPVDVHRCGSIRLARSEDELTENRRFLGFARLVEMEAEIIDPKRIRTLYPLIETPGIVGGLWLPNDCYTDPSQTTHAYARNARKRGARIIQNANVTAIQRKATGDWRIETSRGVIDAGIVVNCGGMWAREISALVGGVLPAISIEHEYLVTESIPEIEALDFELPMLWDMGVPMYTRADRKGLIVSCYEDQPKFFGLNGVPPDFGQELLPPDLDRTQVRAPRSHRVDRPAAAVAKHRVGGDRQGLALPQDDLALDPEPVAERGRHVGETDDDVDPLLLDPERRDPRERARLDPGHRAA